MKKRTLGFTLIEIMVVLAITILLTALAIGYNRSSGRQLVILQEQAKLAESIARVKALAAQRSTAGVPLGMRVCGFGVHFTDGASDYIIFQDLSPEPSDMTINPCNTANYTYDGGNEFFETVDMAEDSVLSLAFGQVDVTFTSPDITAESNVGLPVDITIDSVGGSSSITTTISPSGQVLTVNN